MFSSDIIYHIANNRFILFAWWAAIMMLSGFVAGRAINKVQDILIRVQEASPISSDINTRRSVTLTQTTSWVVQTVVWIVILIMIGNKIGIPVQVITLFSTVFGAGLGFGMQSIFKDVIASTVHIVERSINVGDFIDVETTSGSHMGTVEKVSLRHIQLSSEADGKIIIPQGAITVIKNYNEGIGKFLVNLYFNTDIDLNSVLLPIREIVDKINTAEDVSDYMDEGDEVVLDTMHTLVFRGISDVSAGRMNVQVEGQTTAGNQFASKRLLLKILTARLYSEGITYYSPQAPTVGDAQ